MQISFDPTPAVPRCLHTDVCPNCGYSLAGLGETGVCPECGRPYDQSQIILYGWARGQHENLSTARKSRLVWLFFGSIAWAAFQGFTLISTRTYTNWFFILFAVVVLMNVLMILRRKNVDHPGLIQVRLNANECVQYDSLVGRGMMWEFISGHIWLVAAVIAVALLVGFNRGLIDAIQFWIWFPLSTCLAIALSFHCRRLRKRISRIPDNAIADSNSAYRAPTPWEKVTGCTLDPAGDDTRRLRICHRNWISGSFPVDAEIRCTPEQAEHLRQWLADRLAAHRGSKLS
jgi:hypothetical protein